MSPWSPSDGGESTNAAVAGAPEGVAAADPIDLSEVANPWNALQPEDQKKMTDFIEIEKPELCCKLLKRMAVTLGQRLRATSATLVDIMMEAGPS